MESWEPLFQSKIPRIMRDMIPCGVGVTNSVLKLGGRSVGYGVHEFQSKIPRITGVRDMNQGRVGRGQFQKQIEDGRV